MNPPVHVGPVVFSARGSIEALTAGQIRTLMKRGHVLESGVRERTAAIIADVRANGDQALRSMAERFDGVSLDNLEVPMDDCRRALGLLDPPLREAMERSARNLATVHRAFLPAAVEIAPEPGIVVGRRPDPLGRVGVYAPGGRAVYPSSLLMGAIPARVAGVRDVIVCSPPSITGQPASIVLAAAALAGVDRVFAVGGAGAIAAMAIGTATVPRVDRIVGPGNAYVAEAKLQLVGDVAMDSPAGPSELLILADESAQAGILVRELVAQAEHDPDAAVIVVLVGNHVSSLELQLMKVLETELEHAPRASIVRESLAARGALLRTASIDQAIAFANEWAAEHVLLAVPDDRRALILAQLRSAGTVFVGESSSVAFGDYMTGANHVLPTSGLARCYSGLSTQDFIRWTSWQSITPQAAHGLAHDVACLAAAEGLPGHASAAHAWGDPDQPTSTIISIS